MPNRSRLRASKVLPFVAAILAFALSSPGPASAEFTPTATPKKPEEPRVPAPTPSGIGQAPGQPTAASRPQDKKGEPTGKATEIPRTPGSGGGQRHAPSRRRSSGGDMSGLCCGVCCVFSGAGCLAILSGHPPGIPHRPAGYKHRETAFARSLVLPGWGQLYAEDPWAGAAYLAIEIVLFGGSAGLQAGANASSNTDLRSGLGAAAGAIWLTGAVVHVVNAFDAAGRASRFNERAGLALAPSPNGLMLSRRF